MSADTIPEHMPIPDDVMEAAHLAFDIAYHAEDDVERYAVIARSILAERERSSDLLEAAQSLITCLDLIDEKHWCQYDHVTSVSLQDAHAAIAKAEGRSA